MVAVNCIYRLSIIGTVCGQQHVHSLHFRSTAASSVDPYTEDAYQTALLNAWKTASKTAYKAMFSSNWFPCQTYQVRKVCGSLPLPGGVDASETVAESQGTRPQSGESDLAPWLAQNCTWRTRYAGRRYRGRSFFGGLYESDVAGALINGPRATSMPAYLTTLVTAFVTPGELTKEFSLFLWSRVQNQEPGMQCHQSGGDIISYQVRDQLARMTSRKAGSGI